MPHPLYRFGQFELDPATRELRQGGVRVPLSPKSFECLAYLVAHRDRAVGRDELISAVWGRVDTSDTVVAQTMLRARKALDDTGDRQTMVRTVSRFGYQWVAPVEEVREPKPSAPADVADATPATVPPRLDEASPSPRSVMRGRWLWATVAVLLLALVGIALAYWPRPGAPSSADTDASSNTVLVLPVVVTPGDAESAWVRLGAMDYIASRLRSDGMVVVPSDQSLHLSAPLAADAYDDAEAIAKLRTLSGAGWVLAPEATRDANGWRMRLQWFERGRLQTVEARANTALIAAASATDAWLRRQGRRSPDHGVAPSALTERLQRIDAELKAGQLAAARYFAESAPAAQRQDARLRVRQGQLEFRSGRLDAATALFQSVLKQPTDVSTRARALMGLGAAGIRSRDYAQAQQYYTQALAVMEPRPQDLDEPGMIGNAYNGRGVAQVEQERMEAGVSDMGRARIAMQRSGDLVEAAMVDSNLGIIETKRGHYPQALEEFDRAIAVFERFQVRDYLAATLSSKASTQLSLAQPEQSLRTVERAVALAQSVEDVNLQVAIAITQARAQLANGALAGLEKTLERLHTLGMEEADPVLREMQLRLRLARGQVAQAAALARQVPGEGASGAWALAAVQASLAASDAATARKWIALAPPVGASAATPWDLARALVSNAEGKGHDAIALAQGVAKQAERDGNPDERVRAGVVEAWLLLAQGQTGAASAVLGDLDTFNGSDYRVAWTSWSLYRALNDPAMIAPAEQRAARLRGERNLSVRPVL